MPWDIESFTNYNPAQKQDPICLHMFTSNWWFPADPPEINESRKFGMVKITSGSSTFFFNVDGRGINQDIIYRYIQYRVWYSCLMTWTKRTPKIWWRTLTHPCWLINIVPYDSPPLRVKSLLALMFLSHSFPCFPLVCQDMVRSLSHACQAACWKPTGCCLEQIMISPIMYLMILMRSLRNHITS